MLAKASRFSAGVRHVQRVEPSLPAKPATQLRPDRQQYRKPEVPGIAETECPVHFTARFVSVGDGTGVILLPPKIQRDFVGGAMRIEVRKVRLLGAFFIVLAIRGVALQRR